MLLIILFIAAAIAVLCLVDGENGNRVQCDFCRVECKQNIQKKYKFCC